MLPLTVALGVAALLLLGAVAWLLVDRSRTSSALRQAEQRIAVLEADLDAALRPRSAGRPVDRAVRRVVRTANLLREQGVGGLLEAGIEDLQSWAADRRAEIVTMAAADGTVTLLFSDIEDSTAINDRVGDRAWVRVLRAHDQIVRARVDQYRGQVVKTAGDGFMVAFRDAEAACRAACKIQRDLRRTVDPTLRRHPVRVRVGIHTGQVVSRDGDYFGRNVAMAARVADLAAGGEVFASDAVREALDEDAAVELSEVGSFALKGFNDEHTVWRVQRR